MRLWIVRGVLLGVLTTFLALVVLLPVPPDTMVLLELSATHGVHPRDLVALALWLVGVGALLVRR